MTDLTIDDYRATLDSVISYPFRKGLTANLKEFILKVISEEHLARALYIGFENPSLITALQDSALEALFTSSKYDWWGSEAHFWGDGSELMSCSRAFLSQKTSRVIEGDPDDITILVLDCDVEAEKTSILQGILKQSPERSYRKLSAVLFTDLQEQDGPHKACEIAWKSGWTGIRVSDSYLPDYEESRAETHVYYIFTPDFENAARIAQYAYATRLRVATDQSCRTT